MFWSLVATLFAGLGAAGIALAIRALSRNRAPRWLIPVFAGLGMMAYQVYIEYTWFGHMKSLLPAEARVVSSEKDQVFWRPWSYLVPQVTGFTVLDTGSIAEDTRVKDVVRFHLYRFRHAHGGRVSEGLHLVNCQTGELVPVHDDGRPRANALRQLRPEDPLRTRVCQ